MSGADRPLYPSSDLTSTAAMSRDIPSPPDRQRPTNQPSFCNTPSGTALTLNQLDSIAPTLQAALKLLFVCVRMQRLAVKPASKYQDKGKATVVQNTGFDACRDNEGTEFSCRNASAK